jgi:peptidoglycan biosynthesis protein MviN/MurJ (putative lipid II flippase)
VGTGAVATLAYAGRLVDPLLATGATAIGTAMLPHAARTLAHGGPAQLRGVSLRLAALVLAGSVPAVLALVLASEPIVRLVFARGAFTDADAIAVASVQSVLALQIPIYLVGMIAARVLAAVGRMRVLLAGNAAALALTVVLDLALVEPLGVAGIAVATVVMRAITVGWLLVACLRALGGPR